MLISRAGGMESAELIETLNGLINLDYVTSSKVNISQIEEVEHAYFRVNPTYARELRDVLRGGRHREEPQRRRRRRG